MKLRARGPLSRGLAAAAFAFIAAAPAAADVRSGVAAWTRGDYAAAVREWEGPARAGDRDAQFNLAQAYRLGRGVAVDMKRAEELYLQAAAQGHAKAADTLGLLLHQAGRRAEALPYLETAATRGDARAQYLLGIALFNGDLVPRNWPRAHALMTLADRGGLAQARVALAQIEMHLSPLEREQAQALATAISKAAEAARAAASTGTEQAQASDAPPTPGAAATGPVSPQASTPAAGPDPAAAGSIPMGAAHNAAANGNRPSGRWNVQLGAFAVPANAEALWTRLSQRRELEGRTRMMLTQGRLTLLLAAGFASREEAQGACDALASSGQSCLVTH